MKTQSPGTNKSNNKTAKASKSLEKLPVPTGQQQTLTIPKAIELAVQHHNAGELSKAESIYRQILKSNPNQPVALHLLGVIAHQVGKYEIAVNLITKAISHNPDYAEAHNNLGVVLKKLNKIDESVASFTRALTIKPYYSDALNNLNSLRSPNTSSTIALGGQHSSLRKPAVAGQFYPASTRKLGETVKKFMDQARAKTGGASTGRPPKAIIVPHAGYVYSGAIAASAYVLLEPAAETIKRVILLGPNHTVPLQYMALSSAKAFHTPLGDVTVDKEASAQISTLDGVIVSDAPHEKEHSLEVHLPFLQVLLGDFTVVPIVVGEVPLAQVASVIKTLWGGSETLIVVSSDLCHYVNYDEARKLDSRTCLAIENLNPSVISNNHACGRFPVGGLLEIAKRQNMKVTTLDVRNSGDTMGVRDNVVGYGSWMFQETSVIQNTPLPVVYKKTKNQTIADEFPLTDATGALLERHGEVLLKRAAQSIEYGLENGTVQPTVIDDYPDELVANGACFVTIKRNRQLRGCIGSFVAQRPLIKDVTENAFASSFKDLRFAPLKASEISELELSISVLGSLNEMIFSNEADFLLHLRPGADGLLIKDGIHQSIFLPFVWSQMPDTKTFVEQLKIKAGLTAGHWSDTLRAWRFAAKEMSAYDLDDPHSIWGSQNA